MGNLRLHLLGMTSSNACTGHRLKTFSISTWHQNLQKLSNITGLLQYHIMLNLIVFISFTTKTMTYTYIQIPHLVLQVAPLGTTLKHCMPELDII